MAIETILERLEKVRRTGDHAYIACCPAHDDRSPSLTLRETQEGKILLHCFAGCSAAEVLHAAGLSLSDLFPDGGQDAQGDRRAAKWPALVVLEAIAKEASIIALGSRDMMEGAILSAQDLKRLTKAAEYLQNAAQLAGSLK